MDSEALAERRMALEQRVIDNFIGKESAMVPNKNASPVDWYRWALAQFNLFDGAPRPKSIDTWIPAFQAWLASGAANTRARTVAQCLLRSWNDELAVPGAGDIWREYAGMDNSNRAGVRLVLEHVRYF